MYRLIVDDIPVGTNSSKGVPVSSLIKFETKEIPMEELRKLSYQPGGLYILENCLVIDNDEAIEELLHGVEP